MGSKNWVDGRLLQPQFSVYTTRVGYLDGPGGLNVCDAISVVFLHPSGNGENVWVKDDVIGVEAHLLHQEVVGPSTHCNLVVP